jgi:hypothetical protein
MPHVQGSVASDNGERRVRWLGVNSRWDVVGIPIPSNDCDIRTNLSCNLACELRRSRLDSLSCLLEANSRPVSVVARSVRWRLEDIEAWIRARA